jgi:hypothetical protein
MYGCKDFDTHWQLALISALPVDLALLLLLSSKSVVFNEELIGRKPVFKGNYKHLSVVIFHFY